MMAQKGRNMLQQHMSADCCQCILLDSLLVPGLPNARYVYMANIGTKNSAVVSYVASLRIRLRRCGFSLLALNEGK